ncbi:MAG TPA: hypothetical protein VMN57_17035 [Anaerolineales bacterium]|nr:hypothetical protein [Anaerolineales bacterium]
MAEAIGRLLRAATAGFVIGMRVSEWDAPEFGALVRIPLGPGYEIYGLIHDIHIDDDGLVRQLITADDVDEAVIADNRENRNIPIEISVIAVGHAQGDRIRHTLPPRPPLSLDAIYLCDDAELAAFTGAGSFGYFRHILRAEDAPVGELLSAHLEQSNRAHIRNGDPEWIREASRELIVLLRDDYPTLMSVLSALGDADIR